MSAVHYTITSKQPSSHVFNITLTISNPDPQGQIVSLPSWIPGSYMIREFAKNIVTIAASSNNKKIALTQLKKDVWQAAPCKETLVIQYDVYAWDLSVRTAHLDQTHAFFNGTSVFLRVDGQENTAHIVDIQCPEGSAFKKWRIATALPELKAKRYGFGTYHADNYDALVDHPVEMGDFALVSFKAHGVPHDMVFTGNIPNLNIDRIADDVKKICETEIAFFEPKTKKAPMDRYVFLTMVVGDGYGGLEHRSSTALICTRDDLPAVGQKEQTEGYRTFLGLCSHEYFHTWNVKRIKPAVFAPYDLSQENYTSLLWFFEGITSYYDDLFLVRSGLITGEQYFTTLSKTINNVLKGRGRLKQSVAESSFDAWTKYYRQDENAPNAIVSYYTKGSLVALGLDLTIREATKNKKTLDDVMRYVWQQYGKSFYSKKGGVGIPEAAMLALFEDVSGVKLGSYFTNYIYGTKDVPLAKLLKVSGIEYTEKKDSQASLGIRTSAQKDLCKITHVYEDGAAYQAGVSAGDTLLAIDQLKVPAKGPETLLKRYQAKQKVNLVVFRRDELMMMDAILQNQPAQVSLALAKTTKQLPQWMTK